METSRVVRTATCRSWRALCEEKDPHCCVLGNLLHRDVPDDEDRTCLLSVWSGTGKLAAVLDVVVRWADDFLNNGGLNDPCIGFLGHRKEANLCPTWN